MSPRARFSIGIEYKLPLAAADWVATTALAYSESNWVRGGVVASSFLKIRLKTKQFQHHYHN